MKNVLLSFLFLIAVTTVNFASTPVDLNEQTKTCCSKGDKKCKGKHAKDEKGKCTKDAKKGDCCSKGKNNVDSKDKEPAGKPEKKEDVK